MESSAEDVPGTTEQVKQQMQQVTAQAQEAAGQVVDQGLQQAKSLAAAQKDRASLSLTGVAEALRQTGRQLEEQGQGPASQALSKAAGQFERVAGYLESREISEVVGDTENFARRQPILFLGGAIAVGFLASRFLKSSTPDRTNPPRPNLIAPTPVVGQYEEHPPKTPEAVSEPSQTLEERANGTST